MFNFGQETSCTYPRAHPLPQPFPWYNAYLPSPFEDQNNLAPTNQHAIPIYMTTPPLLVKDSVVAETPCNPKIISSSTFLKSHSDYSKEILNTYGQQQVAPTGLHDHPQITRKKSSGGGGESSNANNKKSKDRHSKIVTTARPRHRRMRLSIDVAREFFDLQDKLKFERASKTVEWLLRKAKADIEKLFEPENEGSCSTTTTEMKTPSNSNSCEGASGLDEIGNIIGGDQAGTSSKPVRKERKRHKRLPPKRPRINPLAKEQREKARERARERTKGWKSKNQATLDLTTVNDYHGSTIANPSKNHINQQSYQSVEEHGNDFNQNMIINDHNCFDQSLMLQVSGNHERSMFEKDPIANCWNFQGHIDPLPTTSTTNAPLFNPLVDQMEHCWNPTLVATSQHNFGGTTTGLGVLQEALVSDYPLSEKSWEAYSSQNLF